MSAAADSSAYSGLLSDEITEIARNPPLVLRVEDVAGRFLQREIRCWTNLRANDIDPLDLIHAVRGALGRLTLSAASRDAGLGHACSFRPASLHDLMFLERTDKSGRPLPRPYRFGFDVREDGSIALTVRLFGLAVDSAAAIAELLALVLVHPVHLRGHAPLTPGLVDRAVVDLPLTDLPIGETVQFATATPLRQRRGKRLVVDDAGFKAAILQRYAGLAMWHGFRPAESMFDLRQILDATPVHLAAHSLVKTERHSKKQNREMAFEGWIGSVTLQALTPQSAAILAMTLENGVGSSSALGYGTLQKSTVRSSGSFS